MTTPIVPAMKPPHEPGIYPVTVTTGDGVEHDCARWDGRAWHLWVDAFDPPEWDDVANLNARVVAWAMAGKALDDTSVPAMKPSASEREALAKIIALHSAYQDTGFVHVAGWMEAAADAVLDAGFRRDPGWIASPLDGPKYLAAVQSPMTDHDWLQLKQAAAGCTSGIANWPHLRLAIAKVMRLYSERDHYWMNNPPAPDDNDKAREGKG